jgi:hypothetical protein
MPNRRSCPMSRRIACHRTLAFPVAVIALAIASAASAQNTAAAAVYRCKQPNGAITYQDYPCKGGVTVEIKPETIDPRAIERLRRAEAEFDRSYAQRRAAEAPLQRRELVERRRETPPPAGDNSYQAPEAGEAPQYLLYGPLPRTKFDRRDRHSIRRIAVPHHRTPAIVHRRELS